MGPLQLLWAQVLLSSDILQKMNETVNPCDDFYEFACGNYHNTVNISEGESAYSSYVEVAKRINSQLKSVLEIPIDKNDTRSSKMAKSFYKSCMNVKQLEKLGLEPLKSVIEEAGGWPMINGSGWKEENYDWMQTFAIHFRIYSLNVMLAIRYRLNPNDQTKLILMIDMPSELGLGKPVYYLDKNHAHMMEAYREYMLNMAIQLGADNKTAAREVQDTIDFEIKLANITDRQEIATNSNKFYDTVTIARLKKKYPKIPFRTFFDDMAEHDWELSDTTDIEFIDGPYLDMLSELIERTSKRLSVAILSGTGSEMAVETGTLANYQMWAIVREHANYIAPRLRENVRKFRAVKFGTQVDKERSEECVEITSDILQLAIEPLYIKHYFSADAKDEVEVMVSNLRTEMAYAIMQSPWMDQETKQMALKKLNSLIQRIGYPVHIFNETRILRGKEQVELKEDQYMENALALAKMNFNSAKIIYSTPATTGSWGMSVTDVNAQYSANINVIAFPAGILQSPFYSPNAPAYVNYGRIGSFIGHEITHGYDNKGRNFGPRGEYESWWTVETLGNFQEISQCFIEQYGSIEDKITGYKLNGELELYENMADNGGVKLAYKAYRFKLEENLIQEPTIPRLGKYTSEQLFFISFAQGSCEIIRKEALERLIINSAHAPRRYRTNVPLQNLPAFAKTFSCPEGSFMNPTKKCLIW